MRKKTNFFIVGAAKAGTSALHDIIGTHKDVFMSPVKEPNFFSNDINIEKFRKGYLRKHNFTNETNKNFGHEMFVKNKKDYDRLFENANDRKIIGESSVSYLYSKVAAREIYDYNPNSKVLVLLRDPVERAYSHYLMNLKVGFTNNLNFVNEIEKDYSKINKGWGISHLYIELGLYYEQIKRYKNLFGERNLLIMSYSEFKFSNQKAVDIICDFLEIDRFSKNINKEKVNSGKIPSNHIFLWMNSSRTFKNILKLFLNVRHVSYLKKMFLKENHNYILTDKDRKIIEPYFKWDNMKLKEEFDLNY